jgi:DNA polymerase III delta prime subunit
MHAYLLSGTDEKAIKNKVKDLIRQENATLFEFEVKKIADTRNLSKFTNLLVSEKTAIFIKNIDQATTEALNAFLKNLEEPQENLFYILTATSSYNVLPTIVSRCQVIRVGNKKIEKEDLEKARNFLDLSIAEKLVYIKDFKQKDQALKFIETIILAGQVLMKKETKKKVKVAKALKKAALVRERIVNNANCSLQLTSFCLSIV